MTIATLNQTISISGVEDVVVTDAQLDGDTGDFVREIRIIGADEVPVFIVRIASNNRDKINVTAPEQQF